MPVIARNEAIQKPRFRDKHGMTETLDRHASLAMTEQKEQFIPNLK